MNTNEIYARYGQYYHMPAELTNKWKDHSSLLSIAGLEVIFWNILRLDMREKSKQETI